MYSYTSCASGMCSECDFWGSLGSQIETDWQKCGYRGYQFLHTITEPQTNSSYFEESRMSDSENMASEDEMRHTGHGFEVSQPYILPHTVEEYQNSRYHELEPSIYMNQERPFICQPQEKFAGQTMFELKSEVQVIQDSAVRHGFQQTPVHSTTSTEEHYSTAFDAARRVRRPNQKDRIHMFVQDLLADAKQKLIRWENTSTLTIEVMDTDNTARLWAEKKSNKKVSYDNFTRAIRYSRQKGYFVKMERQRPHIYRLSPKAVHEYRSLERLGYRSTERLEYRSPERLRYRSPERYADDLKSTRMGL